MKPQTHMHDYTGKLQPMTAPLASLMAVADNGYIHWSTTPGRRRHQVVYGLQTKTYTTRDAAMAAFTDCILHGWST